MMVCSRLLIELQREKYNPDISVVISGMEYKDRELKFKYLHNFSCEEITYVIRPNNKCKQSFEKSYLKKSKREQPSYKPNRTHNSCNFNFVFHSLPQFFVLNDMFKIKKNFHYSDFRFKLIWLIQILSFIFNIEHLRRSDFFGRNFLL
jgi:hypothetical protein